MRTPIATGAAATQELARALLENKKAVAEAFARALELMPRWKLLMDSERAQWDEFVRSQFFAFVDYLAKYFGEGDATFKQLLLGEKIKSLYDPEADHATRQTQANAINAFEFQGLADLLREKLSAEAWDLFSVEIAGIHGLLSSVTTRTQRVLLIGDCIFLDVLPFAVVPLLEAGVKILPDYAASRNPLELRDQIRRLSERKFDLVFYSPFTYDFAPEYSQLAHWRGSLRSGEEIGAVVERAWRDTHPTLELVADLFDCPIHIHNSAAVVREENAAKRFVKLTVSARARAAARQQVNELLAAYVRRKNQDSFKHLSVLDEDRAAQRAGELRAGAFYYHSPLQHPAAFGRILAPLYIDAIYVNAHLIKKKVVVCDLDHTLWDGLIGEGAVRHYHDRQTALKGLKAKGVVLAINSKNDPAKVHWRDATLNERDFVHLAISWDLKASGMTRMQDDLNLKMKDFVFIDDRKDELELMRITHPEVLCLDANDASTWRRLGLWKDSLEDDVEMDRTLMYQQREQRKAFAREDVTSDEEKAALFRSLGLRLTIARARKEDLKRIAELINRTNQFNLEGNRTSLKEVSRWHFAEDHVILAGRTADRFGDMGTTCVAAARIDQDSLVLLVFVLSCRVFGYGIERSIMNHLKSLAAAAGVRQIKARYVPNSQNAPCREFLPSNGFRAEENQWVFDIGSPSPSDVEWLRVELGPA